MCYVYVNHYVLFTLLFEVLQSRVTGVPDVFEPDVFEPGVFEKMIQVNNHQLM